jgi:hypothetical protein
MPLYYLHNRGLFNVILKLMGISVKTDGMVKREKNIGFTTK